MTERILELAIEHHLAGRSAEAEGLYRDLLAAEPENADALHRLGVLAMQKGDISSAIELVGRAAAARPESANIQASLGQAFSAANRAGSHRRFRAGAGDPSGFGGGSLWTGDRMQSVGKRENAVEAYQRLLAIRPDHADVRNNLGNALFGLGQIKQAAREYRRAMELQPNRVEAIANLGSTQCFGTDRRGDRDFSPRAVG